MSLKAFETTEISDLQTGETQSVSYFDLSGFANLKELPREQEAASPPIYIPNGLLFGAQIATSVYVNENGLFSFNEPFSFSHPNPFPTDNIYSRLSNVVAPFWSDNDIRKNGTVRYVDINIRDLTHDHENHILVSDVLAHLRKTGTTGKEFQPTWMIVAQWDKVPPFSQEGASSKTNTYQGIIITDGVNTYYVFTYICGELQWSVGSGFDHAVVGYNSHGDYFYNIPGSGYENIADLVSCSFQVGNRRRRNTQQKSIVGQSAKTSNPAVRACCNKIQNERGSISDAQILKILENLPDCPPNSDLAKHDNLFEQDPTKAGCFCSKIQVDPTNIGAPVQRAYAFVQQCCYYSNGSGLITSGVDAGLLLEIRMPEFESGFYNSCCIESTLLCPKYRTRRPINNGSNYEPPVTGSGFGDPHYKTFDGYQQTFNGNDYRYYAVLKIEQNHINLFTLQSDLDGLVMRSLAFGIQGVESYQYVHNNQAHVYITTDRNNPTNLTFNEDGVNIQNLFQLRRTSSESIEAIYQEKRIVLSMIFYPNAWEGAGILSFDIQIPRSLCNNSKITISGHLGNCDGNSSNDAIPPESPGMIPENSPELLFGIFECRKRRQVPDQLPINCTSTACSDNSSYAPPKFEDFTFTDAEIQFCNNVSTCLYDLAVTGSEELAATTRSIDENETRTMGILKNNLPKFNGIDIFKVTVGTENIYTFSVKDADDNVTVTIVGGAPNGGQLVHNGKGMYTLHWMMLAIPTSSVQFKAEDARSAVVLLSPLLHVCSCFNGGTCTMDGVVRSADSLINMTCLCTEAYGGDSCTEDRNGCSEIECFEGVECFDVPAPGVGAVCGSCPPGYTGDGLRCFDIDECSVNNSSLCAQVCKNTVGGYACGCYTGYMLVSGSSQCQDIDECSGVDNNCQQQCNNTVGSYLCSCQSGFHLNADGATCSTQQTCTGENSCSHICAVIGGMEKCFCPVGLELAAGSTTNCVDIDECVRFSPCNQVCNNTMGSYVCSCEGGYELEDMRTCQDVDECKAAALNNTQLCFDNTQCVNTPGSYNCTCAPGYILVNGKCERGREMAAEVKIIIPSIGQNNSLTFVVQTYDKSELTSDKIQAFRVATADAINRFCAKRECTLMTSNGETQSMDSLHVEPQDVAILTTLITVSSTGRPILFFYVQKDNDTFVSVSNVSSAIQDANDIYRDAGFLSKDLCAQHTPCLNGGTCTSVGSDSGYTCICATGYTGRNCTVHIDGCASNMCLNGGTCIRVGSDSGYTCTCAAGYTGRNCTVHIDGCASNVCLNGGTCTSVDSDNGYTCTCATGYTGRNCSVDIDDCASNPCQNGGTCTDGVGRFVCTCPSNMTGDRCEQGNNINTSNPLPVIIGVVAGVLLLFLFVLLVATVYCIWRRVANCKKYAMDSNRESRNIPMQEHKHKENVYLTVPFKNSQVP